MTELAAGLAKRGHRVTAVASFPHYGKDRVPDRYRRRIVERDWYEGVRVLRTYVYVSPRRDLMHRLVNYLSFSLSSLGASLGVGRVDVVFACSPPLTTGLVGALVACLKGAPLVFNPQDIYPDVAVKLGLITNRRIVAVMAALERWVYARARRIAVISEAAKLNLVAKGVPPDKVDIVENWADTALLAPGADGQRFRRRYGLEGKRIVMYSGNVGLVHGLHSVIDCANLMQGDESLVFAIVGEGNGKADLRRYAAERRAKNVCFLPTQPRSRFAEALAAADLCLVTLGRGMSTSSVPSKAYSIMAAGRPMVAAVDEGSEIWQLVERAGCGVCVPPDDPGMLAKVIRGLLINPRLCAAYGAAGREHVVRHNARDAQIARYEQVLREATSASQSA